MVDFTQLSKYLESLEGTYGVPSCDLVVYHNHKPVYRHSCGYSDVEKTKPVANTDMYWIYSASKVITCTAVMQLIEQGKLGLYDNLSKYLPEYAVENMKVNEKLQKFPPDPTLDPFDPASLKPAQHPIRIVDLMAMQGGFTYNYQTPAIQKVKAETNNKATTRQIIAALAESPLAFDPGEHWAYSLAHDVLAAVVEVVSGMKFSRYLQDNIFSPLGMNDVKFKLNDEDRKRLSALYRFDFKTEKFVSIPSINNFDISDEYESGGAGIACTVDAYGLLVDALSNNGEGANGARILTKESIDLMRENRQVGKSLEDFTKSGKVGYGYGLGVRTLIDRSQSKSPLGEFGWDGAACAYVMVDPENHIGVFLAMHTMMFIKAYFEIHPKIRDLVYTSLGIGE